MGPILTIKAYTESLKAGRLLGLKCRDCGTTMAPPRPVCRNCSGTNLDIAELSGKGQITTFTVIHVPPENRQGQPPYIIIMVELDEGPWIMANLSGIDADTASMSLIGQKVKMIIPQPVAEKRPEEGIAPLFVLQK